MKTNNMFGSLLKHDLKMRKRQNRQFPRAWRLLYLAFGVIIALVVATYVSLVETVQLNTDFWYFNIGLIFAIFGMSIGITKTEWRNGTSGWWLTLPLSRFQLVASKFLASLIRGGMLFLTLYGIIAFFTFYIMLISNSYNLEEALQFLWFGLKSSVLILSLTPFVAGFGVMYGVVGESKARPLMPLVWVMWGGVWILTDFIRPDVVSYAGLVAIPSTFVLPIMVSCVLALVMLRVSSYLLDRHLTI